MSAVVTMHVFSGRPDPAWELTEDQRTELADRLARFKKTTLLKPPGILGALGYRGFTISTVGERDFEPEIYVHAGIVDTSRFGINLLSDDPDLEEWLLSTGGNTVDPSVVQYVSQELSGGKVLALASAPTVLTVPPFNPGKWNNNPTIQKSNNCYNYANDKITNTFAQPGRGSGRMWSQLITCTSDVDPCAQHDGEISVGPPTSTPIQGHFIALVLAVNYDYHWYRLDSNGLWSHKPGQTPARNTDNAGALITDPQHCSRAPYGLFCGFYHCIPANTRIN
ncbi:hypothetical protein PQR71_06910 [Paraburkholderia fungorum]|uniref:hypothetical protein n=1 Tax=Paraburkholderia fungorum TaxID=134537 RepID=UPI0038BDC916